MWIGRKLEMLRLGSSIAYGVVFVIGEMVEHQGIVISVGTDISGVEIAEIEEMLYRFLESSLRDMRNAAVA